MIWAWRNQKWEKAIFAQCSETGILACPGPSLAYSPKNLQGPQRTVFAINTAYPKVRPDYWIGMDEAFCTDPNLVDESFPKIYRGSYSLMKENGIEVRQTPSAYFADVIKVPEGKTMLDMEGKNGFAWHKHTLGVAIHFMIWMGVKRIGLLGCDLGGNTDYYHDLILTEEQRKRNRLLYSQQIIFLNKLANAAQERDINFFSLTQHSPINNFLEYVPINQIIEPEIKIRKPRYVLDKLG